MVMWTPRVRRPDLRPADPMLFTELVLVERYGLPDSCTITGDVEWLRPGFDMDTGILLVDADGQQRLSGVSPTHPKTKTDRRGDGTATLTYESDTVRLWEHFCWPSPTQPWNAQVAAYDVQTDSAEDRIIGYINRNVGAVAYNGSGGDSRRIPTLLMPVSADRGPVGKTSARFDRLGELVATLANLADLRVTVEQVYVAGEPFLQVMIRDVPDLSAWARFGDARSGDLGILDDAWRYGLGVGVSAVLGAAGGEKENRLLRARFDADRRTDAGRRIEAFVSMTGTTDLGEVSQGLDAAVLEGAPTVEVSAPLAAGALTFGPAPGSIPVGAKVAIVLDGEPVIDRITELTTTVTVPTQGTQTQTTVATVGAPDVGLRIDQRRLRAVHTRVSRLERDQ